MLYPILALRISAWVEADFHLHTFRRPGAPLIAVGGKRFHSASRDHIT